MSCSAPVTQIRVDIVMYRNGPLVADSGWQYFNGKSSGQANAASNCITGSYGSWRTFYVAFPPGYTPVSASWPPTTNDGYGPGVSITC